MYDHEETFWFFVGMREISATLLRPYLSPGKKLVRIDLGCGTGINIQWLDQFNPACHPAGMDYSHDALLFCQKRNLRFLCQGSVTDLPFRSDFYDPVTSFDVMCNIPRGESGDKTFAESYRILKPGCFSYGHRPINGCAPSMTNG